MGGKTKALITILAVIALGIVGFNAIGVAQSTGPVDISGPCDEAEHASDLECANVPGAPSPDDSPSVGVDVSGPCDEAEHANDPRCTGQQVDDDNSGPGNGDDDDNSGPGNGADDDDNSGHGSDD